MQFEMKKTGWHRVVIALLVMTAYVIPSKGLAVDNLSFKGRLVAVPCTIRPGDEVISLDLQDIASSHLYLNTRSIGQPFYIHLEGCDTRIGDSVTTTFSGRENAQLPGLLALDSVSVASGIAIGIETPQDQPLPLNVASAEQRLSDGNNVIALKAYVRGEPQAIARKRIRAGQFEATSTFTLTYP